MNRIELSKILNECRSLASLDRVLACYNAFEAAAPDCKEPGLALSELMKRTEAILPLAIARLRELRARNQEAALAATNEIAGASCALAALKGEA